MRNANIDADGLDEILLKHTFRTRYDHCRLPRGSQGIRGQLQKGDMAGKQSLVSMHSLPRLTHNTLFIGEESDVGKKLAGEIMISEDSCLQNRNGRTISSPGG
jgi:hypothetical protein